MGLTNKKAVESSDVCSKLYGDFNKDETFRCICLTTRMYRAEMDEDGRDLLDEHTEYVDTRVFRCGDYPVDRIKDLLISLFISRIISINPQASCIYMIANRVFNLDEHDYDICTLQARYYDDMFVEAIMYEDTNVLGPYDTVPEDTKTYRGFETLNERGWDAVFHSAQWPSDRNKYNKEVLDFFLRKDALSDVEDENSSLRL